MNLTLTVRIGDLSDGTDPELVRADIERVVRQDLPGGSFWVGGEGFTTVTVELVPADEQREETHPALRDYGNRLMQLTTEVEDLEAIEQLVPSNTRGVAQLLNTAARVKQLRTNVREHNNRPDLPTLPVEPVEALFARCRTLINDL